MKDLGYFKGEKCNRNGCNGIIDEHEKEGECTCHINPPCSYCTTQTSYCPKCGWSASEEEYEYHLNRKQAPFVYKHKTESRNSYILPIVFLRKICYSIDARRKR